MNSWITALISLSFVAHTATAFTLSPKPLLVRGPLFRRGPTTSLPYLIDAELSDYSLLEMPVEHSVQSSITARPGLDDVKLSLLPSGNKDGSVNSFPLVVRPEKDSSLGILTDFARYNKDWIDAAMLQYGAILFRGFDVDTAAQVETAIHALEPNLNNKYRGTSPRNVQEGTEYVFSAAEVPSHWPIAQHLEMSFLPAPPRRLFFCALKAPKTSGGETALADFRKVYNAVPTKLRNKLAKKKILYTRTHHEKGANPRFTSDVASVQSWMDVFETNNKTRVEQLAREEHMPMKWTGRNQDTFVSEYVSEPFQLHPVTKEPVWFNHAQVFHHWTTPAELWFAFGRTREWRFLVSAISTGLMAFFQYGLFRRKMALDVAFGDGTPISMREMGQIRKAVHDNSVFTRWEKGDILMIDNFIISHGRQPTMDQNRKVVVAWSDPLEKANEMQ